MDSRHFTIQNPEKQGHNTHPGNFIVSWSGFLAQDESGIAQGSLLGYNVRQCNFTFYIVRQGDRFYGRQQQKEERMDL